jgi:hypothetical protein
MSHSPVTIGNIAIIVHHIDNCAKAVAPAAAERSLHR